MESDESKKIAIVFMATSNMLFALAEMLVNLQKTNGGLYDNVIVYHSDFTENDLIKLQRIEPRILFKRYTREDFEKEHKAVEAKQVLRFINRYSHLAYSKYKIFELLEDYTNVLYLDLDMIIKGDLSDLFESHWIAWRDGNPFGKKFNDHLPMNQYSDQLENIPHGYKTPNGGLIHIRRDNLDWKRCLEVGREFLICFMDYFYSCIDELTIAWITYKLGIPVTHLDRRIYNTFLRWYGYDTKIVHFIERNRPWNDQISQTLFPEWVENYKIADQIAHFENDIVVIHEKPYVNELLCEEAWKEFFAETSFKIPNELNMVKDFNKRSLVMEYKDDVFYEFVRMKKIAGKYFVRLWIKDKEMIRNELLRQRTEELKKDFSVKEDEKGLRVYSGTTNAKRAAGAFKRLYSNTIGIIKALGINKNALRLNNFLDRREENEAFLSDKIDVYFSYLCSAKRYTLIISAKDKCLRYWDEFVDLSGLPLKTSPIKRGAYAAVLQGEKTIFERSDEKQLYMSLPSLVDGLFVTVFSEGSKDGRLGMENNEIRVNNIDYSMHGRGLNFVVINNDSKKVVDSFYIDTWKDNIFEIKRNQDRIDYISILETNTFSNSQESL